MMIWIFINFLFLLHNSAAETHLYPPAGCNNCERKLSPFCCAVAWNGICCEYPIADQVKKTFLRIFGVIYIFVQFTDDIVIEIPTKSHNFQHFAIFGLKLKHLARSQSYVKNCDFL